MSYEAIVMGVSAGGLEALKTILPALPENFVVPIIVVQHRNERTDEFLVTYLDRMCKLAVREPEDKEPIRAGHVYIAPGGYHLLVELDKSFSLSEDARVNYSCPSIDVLFESAADAFASGVIGVVLTGANSDGANGLKAIKEKGGIAIVQDPATAEAKTMPQTALAATTPDHVVALNEMAPLFIQLTRVN